MDFLNFEGWDFKFWGIVQSLRDFGRASLPRSSGVLWWGDVLVGLCLCVNKFVIS